jgi:subtilisin family serine protease
MSRARFHSRVILGTAALTGALLGTACSTDDATAPSPETALGGLPTDSAPLQASVAKVAQGNGRIIPGKYIVVLKDEVRDVPGVAGQLTRAQGGMLRFHFAAPAGFVAQSAAGIKPPKGFVVANLSEQAAAALARDPNVSYIEPDQVPSTDATQLMPTGQPWGLDRIDQRSGLSRTYTYTYTGAGVNAYILDTGLQTGHPDFGGRARIAYDALGGTGTDCDGHGTHVAGTVGGTTYGVAKKVRLYGVKVLYGRGCAGTESWENVIRGLSWVYYHRINPAVVNMSLGGGYSRAVNEWVTALTNSGVFVAVAAGNENANACNVSPASTPAAFTTAGSGSSVWVDDKYSSSNWGSCVDGYAPAYQILSARRGGGAIALTGTSMASPHVAGLAALLKHRYGNVPSAWIDSTIKSRATKGVIRGNVAGTRNALLFKGAL